jgi:hypothetical protein
MKKIISLALFLSVTLTIPSQTSAKLDEKNGFKDFQIGDLYSKWQTNLKLIPTKGEIKKYKYIGTCCQTVFLYDVSEILLEFKADKLINIIITLKQWEKSTANDDFTDLGICIDELEKLAGNFETLFGDYSDFEKDQSTGMITYSWHGNKIAMTCGIQYQGIREGCKPFVILGDFTVVESGF